MGVIGNILRQRRQPRHRYGRREPCRNGHGPAGRRGGAGGHRAPAGARARLPTARVSEAKLGQSTGGAPRQAANNKSPQGEENHEVSTLRIPFLASLTLSGLAVSALAWAAARPRQGARGGTAGARASAASVKAPVVRDLDPGMTLYPSGDKYGIWWKVTDELGNEGRVPSTLFQLAK